MIEKNCDQNKNKEVNRRDFIILTTSALTVTGIGCAVWPFIDSLNPSEDILASSVIEIDLSNIKSGETAVFKWRGKPVFIKHRTPEEILISRNTKLSDLKDPELDQDRTKPGHEKWLIVLGICTHLGCIPINNKGDYGGWLCPCHGSHYDLSGRIRKGPAPKNLEIPHYRFVGANKISIG